MERGKEAMMVIVGSEERKVKEGETDAYFWSEYLEEETEFLLKGKNDEKKRYGLPLYIKGVPVKD
jgi:hypothetical protein